MKNYLIIMLVIMPTLIASYAQAVTVAVFPVEDLSEGRNGVNFTLTDFLQQNLQERGIDVIPRDTIISFMSRNRIRWLGFLGTSHIYQVRDDLGADFVLFGTVSQRQELPLAAFGMVLTLVRTSDARTVWTEVGGVSKADISNFLAIDEPESIDDLFPVLAQQLLSSWPAVLEVTGQNPCIVIESTRLSPQHVKPGDEVNCAVKIRPPSGGDTISQVLLMVGDDNYLEMVEISPNSYSVVWSAPDGRDGFLPVSLVLRCQSGRTLVFFVGNYQIDTSSPKLSLKVAGKRVNNFIAFNDRLPITPVWLDPEPLSRWSLFIQSMTGQVMAGTENKGALPNRFVWKGQRPDGHKAEDGIYEIVLKVWDRANNPSVATQKVFLKSNPPNPRINAAVGNENLIVTLDSENAIPVDFWSAEIMYSDGEVLLQSQGSDLPVDILIPFPSPSDSRKLECFVNMKDVLGNKVQKKIDNLMQLVTVEDNAPEPPKQQEWVPEF
jgi:TolB-like protein